MGIAGCLSAWLICALRSRGVFFNRYLRETESCVPALEVNGMPAWQHRGVGPGLHSHPPTLPWSVSSAALLLQPMSDSARKAPSSPRGMDVKCLCLGAFGCLFLFLCLKKGRPLQAAPPLWVSGILEGVPRWHWWTRAHLPTQEV